MIASAANAYPSDKINVCYIKGKVEYSADNRHWQPLDNMCKVMEEKELLSIGDNSSVGITYKNKYVIFTNKGIYKNKELCEILDKNILPFNDFLGPKYEFFIKNLIEYYKNPDNYFLASAVNFKGNRLGSTMIFPADSELLLANPEIFYWSKGDKSEYTFTLVDDFNKAPLLEITSRDTFVRVQYEFIKDHIYYWSINYRKNQLSFFNTFSIAGNKKIEMLNKDLQKVAAIPKIDEVNKIMIKSIYFEDYKCYSAIDNMILPEISGNGNNELRLYYGLYLKRRGLHEQAEKYLKK